MSTKSTNFPAKQKVPGYKQVESDNGQTIVKPSTPLQRVAAVNVYNEKDVVKHSTPVTIGELKEPKTTGIKMRGAGAATRGFMSRGPMA